MSMMRTSIADDLRAHQETRHCVSEARALSTPMNCEGAEKDKVIGKITRSTVARLLFKEARHISGAHVDNAKQPGNQALKALHDARPVKVREVDVAFCELEKLSDPIIIGCPELLEWGFYLEPDLDTDGLGWVQLAQLGIALPILGSATDTKVNVIDPVLLAGPDYVSVPVKALRSEAELLMQ